MEFLSSLRVKPSKFITASREKIHVSRKADYLAFLFWLLFTIYLFISAIILLEKDYNSASSLRLETYDLADAEVEMVDGGSNLRLFTS